MEHPWLLVFSIPFNFLWPLFHKINRAHQSLIRSRCLKFHDKRWITQIDLVRKPFSIINIPWPLPKSIGHILDSWGASVWSFVIIGGLQSQLWSGNHCQSSILHDLDLWTPKSTGHIIDSWGANVWSFIGGLQVIYGLETISQSPLSHDLDLLTTKWVVHILDSGGASVWSFMIVGELQSQLWSRTTLTCDLLTLKSIGHILDSGGASVWMFMIIGGAHRQLQSGNHFQSPMSHDLDPKINWHILDSWGASVLSFMNIGELQS